MPPGWARQEGTAVRDSRPDRWGADGSQVHGFTGESKLSEACGVCLVIHNTG